MLSLPCYLNVPITGVEGKKRTHSEGGTLVNCPNKKFWPLT